jgi:hypothetical protein
MMKNRWSAAAFVLLALWAGSGCKPAPSSCPTISLQEVQAMSSGHIVGYEEKGGEILVSIGDKYRDCHIFLLQHPGVTREEAIAILQAKQVELDRNRNTLPIENR